MAFSKTYDPAPTSGLKQGGSISNREDLLDVLTILAPEETPVLSSAAKSKANSTFVEWTVDTLDTPSTVGIGEGDDVTSFTDKFASRARLGNFIQKFRRDYLVSDLQEAVDSVGPAKVAQAEAKAIREIKRDIEATLCSNNDRDTEDGTNPYKLRGLGKWLDPTNTAGGGNTDVPDSYKTTAAAVHQNADGDLTETDFNAILTEIFKKTGTAENLTLFADTGLRRHISDYARFAGAAGAGTSSLRKVNVDNGEASIKIGVDLYQSDHGIVSIVNANPDCMTNSITGFEAGEGGFLLNPEFYGVAELIPMGSSRLPNLGGGERGFVDCALTLLMKHPQAHGMIQTIDGA